MNLSSSIYLSRSLSIDLIPDRSYITKSEKETVLNKAWKSILIYMWKLRLSISYKLIKADISALPTKVENSQDLIMIHRRLERINRIQKGFDELCDALENDEELYKRFKKLYPILVKFRKLIDEIKSILEARLKALEKPAVEDDFFKPLSEAELWTHHIQGYNYIK